MRLKTIVIDFLDGYKLIVLKFVQQKTDKLPSLKYNWKIKRKWDFEGIPLKELFLNQIKERKLHPFKGTF